MAYPRDPSWRTEAHSRVTTTYFLASPNTQRFTAQTNKNHILIHLECWTLNTTRPAEPSHTSHKDEVVTLADKTGSVLMLADSPALLGTSPDSSP